MSSPQNKQPVTRTFCNNGTNLEDLTVNYTGMPSSPKGGTKGAEKMVSPGRVRTMKEYEEQMAELKKENFNLKLRIYFIEERQEQMKGLKDVDELFKKNIELSCEFETLKKDLADKEELLLQSAKAMEILQNQHKKQIEELKQTSARDKAYLDDHIANLQKILREKEQTINQFDDSSTMYAMAFGYNKGTDQAKELDDLKSELNNVTLKVVQLEEQLQEERKRYFALECELEQAHEESARLKNQITSLETDVEKRDARLQQAYIDLDRKTEQLNAIASHKVDKKEKTKTDQLVAKEQKISELEAKIGELERRLQAGGVSPTSCNRKSSSDLTNSSKEGVVRQRLRREDKGLTKQLQDAHSKLVQLEEQAQIMQTKLQEAQLTCDNKDSNITKLQEEYHKACVTIQALLKKNKLREKEVSILQSEIEKKEKLIQEMSLPFRSFPSSDNCENSDKNNEGLRKQLELAQEKIAELAKGRNGATAEMENQMQNLKKSLQEKEIRLKELEEKVNSVSMSECKDNRTAELESKLEEMKIKLQSIQHENKYEPDEAGKVDSSKDDEILLELERKKKEVEYLKSELKKRTYNLQELVNKELWDKNREIEKLNKLCERRQLEIIQMKQQLASKDAQSSFIHEKFKDAGNFNNLMMRDIQVMNFEEIKQNCSPLVFAAEDKKTLQDQLLYCWEEKKFLVRKVEELEEHLQNMPERDSDSRLIQTLKSDLTRARQEVEFAENSRKEVVSACSLLTNRLQELADFLDSLLPSLGAKKRRVVQHAVERSRELSKSFSAAADDNNSWQNLQPSLYTPLLPDFSTVDFWSGDDIPDLTLEEEANDEVDTIAQLRSKVESLEQELKQRDIELSKLNCQFTPTFQSMWSLGTNEFESLGAESNNLAKLVSMFESLETHENVDNIVENKTNDGNLDSFVSGQNNVLLRNELKSSNIGEIVISSKKVSSKEDKNGHNIGSESEAWSEPDRSVSLARIGLTDDTTAQSWVHDDSSDTTDNGQKNSLGGKRVKFDAGELRRLQNKIHSLEEANEALRGELSILHKLAPPGLSSMEDKSTSIEGFTEAMPVPPNVLEEIRNQREKLESAIYYNDNIRRQLEAIFVSLKIQDKDATSIEISKDDLSKMNSRCIELENQCKALESQCNDLEVALHTERSVCNKNEEQSIKWEQECSVLREEQKKWKEEIETLENKITELENELKLKSMEMLEKQNSLLESHNEAQKQFDNFERKVKETEAQLKEERDRWLSKEAEIQSCMKMLQIECDELKNKLKKCNEEKREISSQLENFKLEDEKCKKQLNDLNNRLEECKIREEKLHCGVDEWKMKCLNCQKDAEEAKERLQDAEKKMVEMEKINSELEMGLRGQVDAASRQCSQAEYKIKDLEMKHKQREAEWRSRVLVAEREQNVKVTEWRRQLDAATLTTSEMVLERTRLANDKLRLQQEIRRRDTSQLERVKSELERRVAELEAANGELESRLTALQVNKLPSDSENEDQENIPHFRSTKQIKWPSTSTSPPLSPSSKPVSPHLPLSPRYTTQRSNDISSDYMSDQDNGQTCSVFWPQRSPVSASPDLGIESDQGRLSSLETNSHPRTVSIRIDDGVSELAKLEEENVYLRQHLMRTRQALENTLTQLTAANHKKRQVERAICRQLGKTHLILQKARVNLETDVDGC